MCVEAAARQHAQCTVAQIHTTTMCYVVVLSIAAPSVDTPVVVSGSLNDLRMI